MAEFEQILVSWGDDLRCQRRLFVKKHAKKSPEARDQKSSVKNAVFVAGLSVKLANEDCMKRIFSTFGEITTVALHPKKKSCMVVFMEAAAVQAVLKAAKAREIVHFRLPQVPKLGLSAWIEEHKRCFPGDDVLQKEADEWMMDFEKRQQEKQSQPTATGDDDGWTVVSRKKRHGIELQGFTTEKRKRLEELQKNKQMKDYKDLYTNISRKTNRIEAALSLKDQFEQDKKRVAEYKAKREFNG